MSTTVRIQALRILRAIGIKQFRSRSAIQQPFICHLGDSNGEQPYYNRTVSTYSDILLMASWCKQFNRPVIFDVGANVGFVSTQLAGLLQSRDPSLFAFEPVPFTFQRLMKSVRLLGLERSIHPVCAALSEQPSFLRMTYSEWDTMLAQVTPDGAGLRTGNKAAWCCAVTLDDVAAVTGTPALIKLDVEGHEVKVLDGGRSLLKTTEPPAICMEANPLTLSECHATLQDIASRLAGFDLFYANDFEGQRMGFGEPIRDLGAIDWVCNIFAVPRTNSAKAAWTIALSDARTMLENSRGAPSISPRCNGALPKA